MKYCEILHPGRTTRQVELGVIEQVEELSAELDRVTFVNMEILEGFESPCSRTGAIQRGTSKEG